MPRRNPAVPIVRLSVVARGRCRRLLALLLLVSGLLLGVVASASATTVTFLPSAEQEFVVPAGITHIEVSAVGAAGHAGRSCNSANEPPGGAGAKVTAQLTVNPGQKLYIDFGGAGAGGDETQGCGMLAGAGGGASDVREEPGGNALKSLQSRLLVAGGGGGGGGGYGEVSHGARPGELTCPGPYPECYIDLGGAGGTSGSSAQAGKSGETNEPSGKQYLGGGGEGGGSASVGEGGSAGSGTSGSSGVLGEGGAGGVRREGCGCGIDGPGGGGGGGYYGGGGGGGGNAGGGGAAGSSYIAPGATNTKVEADATDPQEVVITTAPVVPPVVVPPVVSPVVVPVVAPVAAAAKALSTTVVAPFDLLITPKTCVSQRKLTIHVVRHLNGMKITSAKVLLAGRVVASLNGPHLIAHLSFAGLGRGAFEVTIVARTSTGSTLTASMIIHTCR
jgi:hypothetical protein